MGGRDDDDDDRGFPEDVYRQMKDGHDRFMRDFDRRTEAMSRESSDFYVSFKDFVDSHIGSIFESFRELPKNISELRKTMQEERQARQNEEEEFLRRWTGRYDATPDHVEMENSRKSPEQREEALQRSQELLRHSQELNSFIDPRKIAALYNDSPTRPHHIEAHSTPMLSPGGACEYMRENGNNGYNMVSSGNAWVWRWPREEEWLSPAWFKRNSYSPVNLESDDWSSDPEHDWKEKFEDLLEATLSKRMGCVTGQIDKESGLSWMVSLFRRGILPPRPSGDKPICLQQAYQLQDELMHINDGYLKTPRSNPKAIERAGKLQLEQRERLPQEREALGLEDGEGHDEDEEDDDMTRWIKSWASTPSLNEITTNLPSTKPEVDVLSSLTTTQTTRLPDGTITTKVVLKEKFADGREETHEKVHTYQESIRPEQKQQEKKQDGQPSRKGGWFWT